MEETVQALIAQLAQLQASLIHTEAEMARVSDKMKEIRYEIRRLIDGEKDHP